MFKVFKRFSEVSRMYYVSETRSDQSELSIALTSERSGINFRNDRQPHLKNSHHYYYVFLKCVCNLTKVSFDKMVREMTIYSDVETMMTPMVLKRKKNIQTMMLNKGGNEQSIAILSI